MMAMSDSVPDRAAIERAVLEAAAARVMALPDSPIFEDGRSAPGIIQVAEARDAVLAPLNEANDA
jgi:hypothetical protein